MICGESNAVKYDKTGCKEIIDPCDIMAAIPEHVQIILNPVHDRMSRFEMVMKRRFLSQNGRVVVSVWNRGKMGANGVTRDGTSSPWSVNQHGETGKVDMLTSPTGFQVGVVTLTDFLQFLDFGNEPN